MKTGWVQIKCTSTPAAEGLAVQTGGALVLSSTTELSRLAGYRRYTHLGSKVSTTRLQDNASGIPKFSVKEGKDWRCLGTTPVTRYDWLTCQVKVAAVFNLQRCMKTGWLADNASGSL